MKPEISRSALLNRGLARLLLQSRQVTRERLELIVGGDNGPDSRPRATPWREGEPDGPRSRMISIPAGMTIAEGLRVVG